MKNVYKNIDEYNLGKTRKVVLIFHDMIAGMISNKKLNQIATQQFIRIKQLHICAVFITQSYFAVAKIVRLNYTYFLS